MFGGFNISILNNHLVLNIYLNNYADMVPYST